MNIDDLLVPRYSLPRLHAQQVESLQQLPEVARAKQAQLLRLGNAAYRYHRLAEGQLTEADFHHWLAGLPPRMRQAMATAGFAAGGRSWAFRHHVLERRDLGYAAFMQQLFSAEDWTLWQQQ